MIILQILLHRHLTPVPVWSSSKVTKQLGCEPTALTFVGERIARLEDQRNGKGEHFARLACQCLVEAKPVATGDSG